MARSKKRAVIIAVVSIPLAYLLLVMPLATVIIYESIFGARYDTPLWLEFSVTDFDGLSVKRSDFESDGETLAGYEYSGRCDNVKGVVVMVHGIGDSGQNILMPFVDYFTDNGYLVFAYDAHGRGESGIGSINGLPQGIIDLDNALKHVKNLDVYRGLPIVLFGHSWGGYSVGNVLALHPDVKAAVIFSGFNESEDMLSYQGEKFGGPTMGFALLYLDAYEKLKFGTEIADLTAVEAMRSSGAGVMLVHGGEDSIVPVEYGYRKIYEAFGSDARFDFIYYEDRDHEYIFCSEESGAYRERLESDYERYIAESGKKDNDKSKTEFMLANFDKMQGFAPDAELMARIVAMYDEYCGMAAQDI